MAKDNKEAEAPKTSDVNRSLLTTMELRFLVGRVEKCYGDFKNLGLSRGNIKGNASRFYTDLKVLERNIEKSIQGEIPTYKTLVANQESFDAVMELIKENILIKNTPKLLKVLNHIKAGGKITLEDNEK